MALALAEGVLGDLREKRVLVVGAGRIGLQSLKALAGRGVAQTAMANRTRERATEVAERFGATAHGLDELEDVLAWADVVVTATSSETPVVGAELVRNAISQPWRTATGLSWIWRCPPMSSASAGAVAGVRLFDVDDLARGARRLDGISLARGPGVEAIVEDEVESFRRRYHELEVEPLLSALRRQAEEIREQELERALSDLGDVDAATAERIEHSVTDTREEAPPRADRPPSRARRNRRRGRSRRCRARAVRARRAARLVSATPLSAAVTLGTRASSPRPSPDRQRRRAAPAPHGPTWPATCGRSRRRATGPRRAEQPLPEIGGKGLFTLELERERWRRRDRPRRALPQGSPDRRGARRRDRCGVPA